MEVLAPHEEGVGVASSPGLSGDSDVSCEGRWAGATGE